MRIILTGEDGQLAKILHQVLTAEGLTIIPFPEQENNITEHTIVQKISDASPDMVIHCAAMTNVDGCAKDPDMAFRVNAFGTQNVAHGCLCCNARMVYISTNEVFDGRADYPYQEGDATNPINPYGSSKLAGEKMAARYLKNLYIVRTAWLFSSGRNNFPAKIMAAADANKELKVVTDEISNPTYAPDLALAIAKLIKTEVYGTYHFVNSNPCSRYDFAKEILRLSGRENVPICPITLSEYPRPSTVPPFAALLNTNGARLGIELRSWQQALTDYFAEMVQNDLNS